MDLTARIRGSDLTPRERRVADLVLTDPGQIAFGTVATVATTAGVGNSTVMRFATKVGFEGFSELQAEVRTELGGRLRHATHRVRRPATGDPIAAALETELANVQDTLGQIDADAIIRAAERLATANNVAVLGGDAARGVAQDFASQLGMLRPHTELVDVGSIALSRTLGWLTRKDVLVVIDTARYESTVTAAVERSAAARVPVLAISDSHVSPIGVGATWSFQVLDTGVGPFDSFVGALALTNLLVSLVTRALGPRAVRHIDRLDADWAATGALREE